MKSFTNIFRRLRQLYERRFEPERLRPLAEGYWRLLIGGGLLGLLLVVLFGTWQFVGTIEDLGSAQGLSSAVPSVALDHAQLDSTLATFEARQSAYTSAQKSSAVFKDPSN